MKELKRPNRLMTRLVSLIVAEVFLCTSILPAQAYPSPRTSHLRPSVVAQDGGNYLRQIFQALRDWGSSPSKKEILLFQQQVEAEEGVTLFPLRNFSDLKALKFEDKGGIIILNPRNWLIGWKREWKRHRDEEGFPSWKPEGGIAYITNPFLLSGSTVPIEPFSAHFQRFLKNPLRTGAEDPGLVAWSFTVMIKNAATHGNRLLNKLPVMVTWEIDGSGFEIHAYDFGLGGVPEDGFAPTPRESLPPKAVYWEISGNGRGVELLQANDVSISPPQPVFEKGNPHPLGNVVIARTSWYALDGGSSFARQEEARDGGKRGEPPKGYPGDDEMGRWIEKDGGDIFAIHKNRSGSLSTLTRFVRYYIEDDPDREAWLEGVRASVKADRARERRREKNRVNAKARKVRARQARALEARARREDQQRERRARQAKAREARARRENRQHKRKASAFEDHPSAPRQEGPARREWDYATRRLEPILLDANRYVTKEYEGLGEKVYQQYTFPAFVKHFSREVYRKIRTRIDLILEEGLYVPTTQINTYFVETVPHLLETHAHANLRIFRRELRYAIAELQATRKPHFVAPRNVPPDRGARDGGEGSARFYESALPTYYRVGEGFWIGEDILLRVKKVSPQGVTLSVKHGDQKRPDITIVKGHDWETSEGSPERNLFAKDPEGGEHPFAIGFIKKKGKDKVSLITKSSRKVRFDRENVRAEKDGLARDGGDDERPNKRESQTGSNEKFTSWFREVFLPTQILLTEPLEQGTLTGQGLIDYADTIIRAIEPDFDLKGIVQPDTKVEPHHMSALGDEVLEQVMIPNGLIFFESFMGIIIPELTEYATTPAGRRVPVYTVRTGQAHSTFAAIAKTHYVILVAEAKALDQETAIGYQQLWRTQSGIDLLPSFREDPAQSFVGRLWVDLFEKHDLARVLEIHREVDLAEELSHSDAFAFIETLWGRRTTRKRSGEVVGMAQTVLRPEAELQRRLQTQVRHPEKQVRLADAIIEIEAKLNALKFSPYPALAFLEVLLGPILPIPAVIVEMVSEPGQYPIARQILLQLLSTPLLGQETLDRQAWLDFLEEAVTDFDAFNMRLREIAGPVYDRQFLTLEERSRQLLAVGRSLPDKPGAQDGGLNHVIIPKASHLRILTPSPVGIYP